MESAFLVESERRQMSINAKKVAIILTLSGAILGIPSIFTSLASPSTQFQAQTLTPTVRPIMATNRLPLSQPYHIMRGAHSQPLRATPGVASVEESTVNGEGNKTISGIVTGFALATFGAACLIMKLRSKGAHPFGVSLEVAPMAIFATTGAPSGWGLAISEADLAKQPNGQARVTVDGADIMVIKEGSKVYAVQARCSHLPLKLLGSKVENGVITCSKHGSKFSCSSGAVEEWLPGEGLNTVLRMASSQPCPLKAYPTQVKDGNVYVNVKQQVAK